LQHILTGKEINRANVFVLDPRFTAPPPTPPNMSGSAAALTSP